MHKMGLYIYSLMKDERRTVGARIASAFLLVLSWIYTGLLYCLYFLRGIKILKSYSVLPKVISVGNITLGGTGKTPFAIFIAEHIKFMGKKVAVLHRGYGSDESYLIKEKLAGIPVIIGSDRVRNALKAQNELDVDCVILDDGFQHYRLKRDLDILLIDATNPFGNYRIFPRGILREPIGRLKQADLIILTKSDMGRDKLDSIKGLLESYNDKAVIAESYYEPVGIQSLFLKENMPLSYIPHKRIAVLCGIGNPGYFSWMVQKLGASIYERFFYSDHYNFKDGDIAHICDMCGQKGIEAIITTEKDAVKLRRFRELFGSLEIFALRVVLRINKNEEKVIGRIHSICHS